MPNLGIRGDLVAAKSCCDALGWLVQGPDWGTLPDSEKLITADRQGSAAAQASNYLWTPNAADCAVDSDARPDTTR